MKHELRTEQGAVIIEFSGDVDLEFSGDLRTLLMGSLPKGQIIIIDLSGPDLIDSSVIASLLEAFQEARKKGKEFITASVNAMVMRVFNLARLETVFDIEEIVESAMKR